MNIIRMTGGLGNQMFQYALFLKLRAQGREVRLDDISEYEGRDARPVLLWAFGIQYPAAAKEDIDRLTDGFMHLTHRLRRKLFGRKTLEYQEIPHQFDPQVLVRETAYLTGYFQSDRYFKDIEEQVRSAFCFSDKIWEGLPLGRADQIRAYLGAIDRTTAVSVHIRRGDYLENEEVYGGICTEAYYEKAMAVVEEKFPEAVFYLFSNDPVWVKEWAQRGFLKERNVEVIEGSSEEKGYLDLLLMSRCRHHIIANSSFSWWGAWLAPPQDKLVIAPSRWINGCECRDIYTKEMIKISPEGKVEENDAGQKTGIRDRSGL